MTEKELRHLSKREWLELLIEQTKENAELKETVRRLEEELNDKRIRVAESGTMAEAALKLNEVFPAADQAAKQYIENARRNEEESRRILAEARLKAQSILRAAEKEAAEKIRAASSEMKEQ